MGGRRVVIYIVEGIGIKERESEHYMYEVGNVKYGNKTIVRGGVVRREFRS